MSWQRDLLPFNGDAEVGSTAEERASSTGATVGTSSTRSCRSTTSSHSDSEGQQESIPACATSNGTQDARRNHATVTRASGTLDGQIGSINQGESPESTIADISTGVPWTPAHSLRLTSESRTPLPQALHHTQPAPSITRYVNEARQSAWSPVEATMSLPDQTLPASMANSVCASALVSLYGPLVFPDKLLTELNILSKDDKNGHNGKHGVDDGEDGDTEDEATPAKKKRRSSYYRY